MELTIERLRAAVRSMGDGKKASPERIPFRYKIRIVDYSDGVCGETHHVWTRDVAAGQLGLVSSSPMILKSKFIVVLAPQGELAPLLVCNVKTCKKVSGGVFDVNVEFNEIISKRSAMVTRPDQKQINSALFSAESALPDPVAKEIKRIRTAILR